MSGDSISELMEEYERKKQRVAPLPFDERLTIAFRELLEENAALYKTILDITGINDAAFRAALEDVAPKERATT